jgi:site-specific DNA-methyltransferase (cytosine-N4-specific)
MSDAEVELSTTSRAICADARSLPVMSGSVDLALWSPPYFATRAYGEHEDEIGRPSHISEYIKSVVDAATESLRCLRSDGSLFINVGDRLINRARVRQTAHQPSLNAMADRPEWRETWAQASARGGVLTQQIAGVREKSLALVPERLAVALYDSGLWVKSHIVWVKTHTVPDPSASDRAAILHESIIQVSVGPTVRSFFPGGAGSVPSVFECPPSRGESGHPAPWPEALVEFIVSNWSQPGDVVLDAFAGSGTTGRVCERLGRIPLMADLYEWSGITTSTEDHRLPHSTAR